MARESEPIGEHGYVSRENFHGVRTGSTIAEGETAAAQARHDNVVRLSTARIAKTTGRVEKTTTRPQQGRKAA